MEEVKNNVVTMPEVPATPVQTDPRFAMFLDDQLRLEMRYSQEMYESHGIVRWFFNRFIARNSVVRVETYVQTPDPDDSVGVHSEKDLQQDTRREFVVKVNLLGFNIVSARMPIKDRTPITKPRVLYADLLSLDL